MMIGKIFGCYSIFVPSIIIIADSYSELTNDSPNFKSKLNLSRSDFIMLVLVEIAFDDGEKRRRKMYRFVVKTLINE